MSGKNKKSNGKDTNSSLRKLKDEWKIFMGGFFRPPVIIPLILTGVSLYVANIKGIDRVFSLVLQIVAAFSLAIAGGFCAEAIKNLMGNNLLVKKGYSAVRNLSLARLKTKNISDRAKKDASSEEINNLLSLLGKDIANATEEWNDILPGVNQIEKVYALLSDKESELELVNREKDRLKNGVMRKRQLDTREKEKSEKSLRKKEEEILVLTREINKLRSTVNSSSLIGSGLPGEPLTIKAGSVWGGKPLTLADLSSPSGVSVPLGMQCSRCGNLYTSSVGRIDEGLCNDCSPRSIQGTPTLET